MNTRAYNLPLFVLCKIFNNFISKTSLQSVNTQGYIYTWCDGRGLGRVWRRLDRYLCSSSFLDIFSTVQCQHLNRSTSDHSPIYLDCRSNTTSSAAAFRYLNVSMTHPDFYDFVVHQWQSFPMVGGMWGLYSILRQLKQQLHIWNKDVFENIFDAIVEAEIVSTCCERAYDSNPTEETRMEYHMSVAQLRMA